MSLHYASRRQEMTWCTASTEFLASMHPSTNDKRPKTLDHANSKATKYSQALQSGEMSGTNMATVMGLNTNLATRLIKFIFNSINLLKKVA